MPDEMSVREIAREVTKRRAEWLEDVLAGLLSNGVAKDEIAVEEHPDKCVVRVRGEARYERRLRFGEADHA